MSTHHLEFGIIWPRLKRMGCRQLLLLLVWGSCGASFVAESFPFLYVLGSCVVVALREELLLFLEEILPACGRGGSSASELGLLRNVLRSKLWQRELPNLLDGSDEAWQGSLNFVEL